MGYNFIGIEENYKIVFSCPICGRSLKFERVNLTKIFDHDMCNGCFATFDIFQVDKNNYRIMLKKRERIQNVIMSGGD